MGTKLSEYASTSNRLKTAESKTRRKKFAGAYRIGLDLHDLRCKHQLTQQERGSIRPNTATLERLGDVLGAELRFVERTPT
jgi:hypothetical protein